MATVTAPAQGPSSSQAAPNPDPIVAALQSTLTDLIALGVLAKHAHWNVTGPSFGSLHALLDDIATVAADASDQVAERIRAVDCFPDGRATWGVVGHTPFDLPGGRLTDTDTVKAFGAILWTMSEQLRRAITATLDDPVSQGVLIDIAHQIDKRTWLVRSHQ